jgi:hypothetical protein
MSYRRESDAERAKAWKAWAAQHQSTLEGIGLPLAVYQDASHWEDFIENGHLHWHSDGPPFDFNELSPSQMERLLGVLEQSHADRPPALVGFLRTRLGRNDG